MHYEVEGINSKLQDLVDEMENEEVLEDRREYDAKMLAKMYELTPQESEDLFYLIQRQFDHRFVDINDKKVDAELVLCNIVDALHGNLDGWDSEHDRIVIMRFVDEIAQQSVKTIK